MIGMELIYWTPNTGGYQDEEFPFRQCTLAVDLNGNRFMDETNMMNPVFTSNTIKRLKNQLFWAIIDEETIDYFAANGPDYFMINTMENFNFSVMKERINLWVENFPDIVVRCESIEELANKTGINKENLLKTVSQYNEFCETRDEDFNKDHRYMRPVKTPGFYAMKFMLSAYGSLGGIMIDSDFCVLDTEHDVIPGLFAAGTDTNDINDPDYVFIMPGSTLGYAFNSGRLAAESAVDYVQELYDSEE